MPNRNFSEHEKLQKVSKQSQAIGDFLEWLQHDKEVTFCGPAHEHDEDDCYAEGRDGMMVCDYRDGEHIPTSLNVRDLLAEFFKINQAKLEAEKRQMLDDIRKADKKKKVA